MTISRPTTASRAAQARAAPFASLTATQVACVTANSGLVADLRAASPGVAIESAANPYELADLLLAGSCGTLVMDLSELNTSATTVIRHLAGQFPDVPIIAVGTRHQEAEVAGLISSGEIYRFLHQPVSAGRAKTFLEAALRRHEEVRPTLQALKRTASHAGPATPIAARLATGSRAAAVHARTTAVRRPQEPWYTTMPLMPLAGAAAVAVIALALGLTLRDTLGRHSAPAAAGTPAVAPSRTAVRGLLRPVQPYPAAPTVKRAAGVASAARPAPAAAAAAAPAPATAAAAPDVATSAGAPRKIRGARPEYPQAARESGTEGWVDVHFTVSPTGEPEAVTVTGAEPRGTFEDAATAAVRQWRYSPRPAPSEVDQRVYFRLSDPAATASTPSAAVAPAAARSAAPAAASSPGPAPSAPVARGV